MSNITKRILESDCVGDSLSKHNYNFLALDQNVCNLSTQYFNVNNNYLSLFTDLCANINRFNTFAETFHIPKEIDLATSTVNYLSGYWQKRELNLTFPVNIYDIDGEIKFYLDKNTQDSALQNYALNQLQRKYPATNFIPNTIANVFFLLFSNTGDIDSVETSTFNLASDSNPQITKFLRAGQYIVPAGVTKLDVLIVAAGGGGGGNGQRSGGGGGGGGGIVLLSNLSVTPSTTYNITVGSGGVGGNAYGYGQNGGNSSFGTYIAYGGSGGHSSVGGDLVGGSAGAGNTTGVGGNGQYSTVSSATNGGNGYYYAQTKEYFGGGGGGGNDYNRITTGGLGGGGYGGHSIYANSTASYYAQNGFVNTGGGGGGAARDQGSGASGGSGIVIVVRKSSGNSVQTTKTFDVNNTKKDVHVTQIKIAKFKISNTNTWNFVEFVT